MLPLCRQGKSSQESGSVEEGKPPHLLREGLQLVLGVDVLPDALHVIPVSDHTMLHGVADGQQPPVLLEDREKADIAPPASACWLSPWVSHRLPELSRPHMAEDRRRWQHALLKSLLSNLRLFSADQPCLLAVGSLREGGVTGPSPKIPPSHLCALCPNCMWPEDLGRGAEYIRCLGVPRPPLSSPSSTLCK